MSTKIEWSLMQKVFENTAGVVAAWVFGSAVKGTIQPESDLDIGVLFETTPSLDECAGLRADLQKSLDFDDIDLVILNDTNPILRFEAISGRPIYCRDQGRRAEFASLTAREYEDEMALARWGLKQRSWNNQN
jgi:predicted nucleotidyltransferase